MKNWMYLMILPLLLTSCGDEEEVSENDNLELNITGLEDLGATAQYEGWVLVNGNPISTGTFTVDANGTPSSDIFQINSEDLAVATKFILTVEPIPDNDPAPSAQKLIAGDFVEDLAILSTAVGPALGDFSAAEGSFFLRTPTDETGGNNGNDQYGVWFGNPGTPPSAGFELPILDEGWIYEGWVIGENGPISTGTFNNFEDRDNSNFFSGTEANAGPPVPGEDFFNNAPIGETFPLDLRGRTVVISVEPVPDNSAAPFLLKPLVGAVPSDAQFAPTTYQFNQNLESLPTGWVKR